MDLGVRIYVDSGEFEVWIGPALELSSNNIINAFIAGVGPTRDAAVMDAVRELEHVTALLQAPPDSVPVVNVVEQESV